MTKVDNPYLAWKLANDSLKETNEILAALNQTLSDLEMPTTSKLLIQAYLLQCLQAAKKYIDQVQPMLQENSNVIS